MSNKSNNQGRAYEFACMMTLADEIGKIRPVIIDKNSSFQANENSWNTMTSAIQQILILSAQTAVQTIFDMEPLLLEEGTDIVTLKFQADSEGCSGDVRDIVVQRQMIQWEIGLSIIILQLNTADFPMC